MGTHSTRVAEFHDRWVLDGGDDYAKVAATPSATPSAAPPRGQAVRALSLHSNEPDEQPNGVREVYLRLIREARRSIFIENPYLYHPAIVDALCAAKAEHRELSVTLVVPSGRHNDNSFSQDAQEHEYARYLECGIEVYEYKNRFNHLKMAVFDERYSIHGSTNLNCRSLESDRDFELVVLIDDEALARSMLAQVRGRGEAALCQAHAVDELRFVPIVLRSNLFPDLLQEGLRAQTVAELMVDDFSS